MFKRLKFLLTVGIAVFLFLTVEVPGIYGAVLKTLWREVNAVYVVPAPKAFPTELGYVITNFGPGNLKFLEEVDVVVDKEGRVQGIQIIYTPPDGYRRQVYLAGNRTLIVKEARPGSLKKRVLFKVVTSEELLPAP